MSAKIVGLKAELHSGDMKIVNVILDGDDGIIIDFSDGTTTGLVVEELLHLRPYRETKRDIASSRALSKASSDKSNTRVAGRLH